MLVLTFNYLFIFVKFEHVTGHISAMWYTELTTTVISSELIDLKGSNLMTVVSLDAQFIHKIIKKGQFSFLGGRGWGA